MIDRLKLKLKIWSRSRYVMAARNTMRRMGVKHVTLIAYERPLDTEMPIIETRLPVEIGAVSAEDVEKGRYQGIKLASEDDLGPHNETLRRLSSGDICLVAKAGDKVTGFAWLYMSRRKYEPVIETEITLGDGEALLYDRLVFREFRRKGIGEKLNEERMRLLRSKDYRKAVGYVESDNIASIKSLEALGFHAIKAITYLKIFVFKRTREVPIA